MAKHARWSEGDLVLGRPHHTKVPELEAVVIETDALLQKLLEASARAHATFKNYPIQPKKDTDQ